MKKSTIIEICVGATLFILIGVFHLQMAALAMMTVGRSQKCPWRAALASMSTSAKQTEYSEYIEDHSKLLAKDELETELWDTPSGKYWIPAGSAKAISY